MSYQLNPYFQAGLDVMGQPCLVIGGSQGGEGRTSRLLDAGARRQSGRDRDRAGGRRGIRLFLERRGGGHALLFGGGRRKAERRRNESKAHIVFFSGKAGGDRRQVDGPDIDQGGVLQLQHLARLGGEEERAEIAIFAGGDALRGGGRVLVHCRGGCGRSGMVALRLMIEAGEAPDEALSRLRSVRPCAVETKAQMGWAMAAERDAAVFHRHGS